MERKQLIKNIEQLESKLKKEVDSIVEFQMAEKMVQFDNFQTTFMNQLNNKFNLKIKEMERKLDKKLKEGLEAQN